MGAWLRMRSRTDILAITALMVVRAMGGIREGASFLFISCHVITRREILRTKFSGRNESIG